MAQTVTTTSKQNTIKPDKKMGYHGTEDSEGAMGRANVATLQGIFGGSPLDGYSGAKEIEAVGEEEKIDLSTPESYRKWFFDNVVDGTISDESYGLGTQDLGFPNAPDLKAGDSDVPVGGEGLPATPFVPNPVSPGEGSILPADQVEAPESFVKKLNPKGPFVGPSTTPTDDPNVASDGRNPTKTSAEIKSRNK